MQSPACPCQDLPTHGEFPDGLTPGSLSFRSHGRWWQCLGCVQLRCSWDGSCNRDHHTASWWDASWSSFCPWLVAAFVCVCVCVCVCITYSLVPRPLHVWRLQYGIHTSRRTFYHVVCASDMFLRRHSADSKISPCCRTRKRSWKNLKQVMHVIDYTVNSNPALT